MKITLNAKCSDLFSMSVIGDDGSYALEDYSGYVPEFMPGDHYGDYVELDIDVDTGRILNWREGCRERVLDFIKEQVAKGNI